MGMTVLYIFKYIEWVNRNAWFTYLLMGTFSYMENIQCYLLWSIFASPSLKQLKKKIQLQRLLNAFILMKFSIDL